MLDSLVHIDQELFLTLHELGHPYLDTFMWWMSNRFIWFPMYAYLIYRLYKHYGRAFYQPLIALIIVIIITDQVTASVMKPFFGRLRPCHDPNISQFISLVGNCGGKYSFASSHAANTFGLAGFFLFLEKSRLSVALIIWAALVSYSRIYLGVHYPADVLVGCTLGLAAGGLLVFLLRKTGFRAD